MDSDFHFNNALIFNDVFFDVAGLFSNSRLIILAIDVVRDKFGVDLPITSIYGCMPVVWNGGRLLFSGKFAESEIRAEFELLKRYGIIPAVTFTNCFVDNTCLLDVTCNRILVLLDEFDGIVVLSNRLLEEYVKQNHPKLSVYISAVRASIEDSAGNLEYYRKLASDGLRYVVSPDDNFNKPLLESLDKARSVIILNERCIYGCQNRKAHYESISREQISFCKNMYVYEDFLSKCGAVPEYKQRYSKIRNISLTLDEYRYLYNMGFRNFKLQGRTDSLYVFFFDMFRYMLEPMLAFSQIYPIMCSYIENMKVDDNELYR